MTFLRAVPAFSAMANGSSAVLSLQEGVSAVPRADNSPGRPAGAAVPETQPVLSLEFRVRLMRPVTS